jgi:integrase
MPKLTKRFIDALKPVAKDTLYRDSELKGFALRVKPPSTKHAAGARIWCVQYRNKGGRTRKLAMRHSRAVTPEEARQWAQEQLGSVAKGEDPSASRHAQRAELTLAQLVDRYLAEGPADKPAKKSSSWTTDASNLKRHVVPLLGRKPLGALTAADVQRFQRDVTEGKTRLDERTKARGRAIVSGGSGTAARATAVLAGMLAWAVRCGLRADNPAKGVRLNKLTKRERFLSAAELARLGDGMARLEREGANRDALAIVRLLLLTGARRNEIVSLRWEHVDFERRALRLADSKTGAKIIPLGAPALDVLARQPRRNGLHWVFPSLNGDAPYSGLPAVWRKLAKATGLKGVRLHDLRHGFASVAVADGSSLYLVGKVLGHSQAATTARYSHLELDPVRNVADRTARKIASALKGAAAGGKVVEIGKRRRG